jgi:hypothetical protein
MNGNRVSAGIEKAVAAATALQGASRRCRPCVWLVGRESRTAYNKSCITSRERVMLRMAEDESPQPAEVHLEGDSLEVLREGQPEDRQERSWNRPPASKPGDAAC